jgi:hypothetical protein
LPIPFKVCRFAQVGFSKDKKLGGAFTLLPRFSLYIVYEREVLSASSILRNLVPPKHKSFISRKPLQTSGLTIAVYNNRPLSLM